LRNTLTYADSDAHSHTYTESNADSYRHALCDAYVHAKWWQDL
jgi:hypothetical protein